MKSIIKAEPEESECITIDLVRSDVQPRASFEAEDGDQQSSDSENEQDAN